MAREIITVPPDLCRVTEFNWDIDWRTQAGAESTTGLSQIAVAGFPRWVGTLPMKLRREHILGWRAIRGQARGRLGLYLVTLFDPLVPLPVEGQPWGSGGPWGGGALWAGEPCWSVTAAAARGATELRISLPDPDLPVPVAGQIISHADWPTRITWADADGDDWVLHIDRPLPVAAVVDDPVHLRPRGIFEAIDDRTGNPAYDWRHRSAPTFELREYLNRE